ncbi:hypothetical protein M0805_002913 [Coniferiporia weirii]|nr:hypothetical protein M0805_002913 [Coniferiporia weirii]
MSDLYSTLHVSPKKKRVYNSDDDDAVLTPKRLRTMAPTPPATPRKAPAPAVLPPHLARFQSLQSSLHRALSHSLATAAVSPSSDTGLVPNVLNNHTLTSAAGLSRTCTLDDLKRLCWLWEWDGKELPSADDDDNPFLESSAPKPEQPKQWNRGAMGVVITPTTHLSKSGGKRVPAYGIGIEVEMDIDKDMPGGMAAVARWTATASQRMKSLTQKLHRWVELHPKATDIPTVPMADLPPLAQPPPKHSALTQRLASLSPKAPKTFATPSQSSDPFDFPPSPSRSSSPTKPRVTPGKRTLRDFAIPFPITPSSNPRHKLVATPSTIPKTPSSSRILRTAPTTPSTPQTPVASSSSGISRPSTPVNQTGPNADTVPSTPTTSRRAALYERIRKRSESQVPDTPSKARITTSVKMTREQLMKLSQEEMRRRCLLGRLGGVAESIWMFFVSPTNPVSAGASARKRRTIPTDEVVQAIIKSSPVPISSAEALESIQLLASLCPFFLKRNTIGGEEWLEMPASANTTQPSIPASPGKLGTSDELKTPSLRRVKREAGGLREVRERIKRELEASD